MYLCYNGNPLRKYVMHKTVKFTFRENCFRENIESEKESNNKMKNKKTTHKRKWYDFAVVSSKDSSQLRVNRNKRKSISYICTRHLH